MNLLGAFDGFDTVLCRRMASWKAQAVEGDKVLHGRTEDPTAGTVGQYLDLQ